MYHTPESERYRTDQLTPTDLEAHEHSVEARNIVHTEDFNDAYRILTTEHLLRPETERTQTHYRALIEKAPFLTERDWELLTLIKLFSPELAEHCVETFELARTRLDHIMIGTETLAQVIQIETNSLEAFYRATLLHDIGKILIPETILNRVIQPGDWQALRTNDFSNTIHEKLREDLHLEKNTPISEKIFFSYLANNTDALFRSTPARPFLTETERALLEQRGISLDLSFWEILQLHEKKSEDILESMGLFSEALLAGRHHNYKNQAYTFPISSQSIGISADLTDLIKLADVEGALLSERSYKPKFSHLHALLVLMEDANRGVLKSKELTAQWIRNSLEDLSNIPSDNDQDNEALEKLQHFVDTFAPISS